ncbi:hypothetical protein ACWKWN_03315 [Microbacterium trichothecenolyticum]
MLIDQGTKALALAQLSEHERIPLLGDCLGLQLAFNPGTVMSLGSDSCGEAQSATSSTDCAPGFGRGHVTDFLAYGNLFNGNLSEVILGAGAALGILLCLRGHTPHSNH